MAITLKTAIAIALLSGIPLTAASQVTLNFDAAKRGPMISPLQYGIFYEEINNAGDGGLYAELIRNRNFEDATNPDHWSKIGNPEMQIVRDGLMNEHRSAALQLTLNGADQGISNTGYWGINCRNGEEYSLSVWIKSDKGYKGVITASLTDGYGSAAASASKELSLDGNWQRVDLILQASTDMPDSRFDLTFSNSGTVTLGMVSLFPPTYKGRENGCRIDLAEKLEALHPTFMRFPGGCYIEGSGTAEDNRRFEWKKTIGPIEQRPGHFNYNWGYPSTDGLGFHEFLQLTEDLGAEPLFVVNVGIGHGWYKDFTDIDEYIQEALDAIEYCNGDISTEWGAKRAANGHPEPFNLRLLEIGNENYNFDDDLSNHYPERYKAFFDAIKAKYPEITLIGNTEAWGTDDPTWRNSFPVEMVDEHYYRSPAWFESKYNKYDSYDRSGPQVYVGEYAVTDQFGTNGHLRAALGEAVYMMGLERNSDIVAMASYAPIFYHEERNGGWLPDMIRFDHRQSYGTPSYWVQKLMPEYLGKQNLVWTEENNLAENGTNTIGMSTWSTIAKYDNIKVTDPDGNILYAEDFSGDLSGWNVPSSSWQINDGQLLQGNSSKQGELIFSAASLPSAYTLEMDATKLSGAEGFLVAVNVADKDNYIWWNLGGWGNTLHGVQTCKNGGKSDHDLKSGKIETGRTYHITMIVDGGHVKCFLDGELIHDLNLHVDRKVYVSSSIDDEEGLMYLKIANTKDTPATVDIKMANASMTSGETVVLTSSSALDENNASNPGNIVPQAGAAPAFIDGNAIYDAPANSLSILSVRLSDIKYAAAEGKEASEEQMETLKRELAPTAMKLNWLHQTTSLPVMTESGTKIEWQELTECYCTMLVNNRHSAYLLYDEDNSHAYGSVVANAFLTDGATATIEYPVNIAPKDEAYGYLYTYMNSGREITNYALGSKEGMGKHFEQLADGAEIFDTETLAGIEGGTRDAYLDRGQRQDEYFITATDMCNAKSGVWNNFGIELLRSSDLIHWESSVFDFREGKKIFSDPEADTGFYSTDGEYANINRVWAPQFIWDETAFGGKGGYLVYYSILSSNSGDNYDRMYYSYADTDFKTLTQPRLLFDPGVSLIDADIVWNEYDQLYHMLVKRTGSNAETTGIFEYTSPALLSGDWQEIGKIITENTTGIEAPTQVRRINEDVWNVYFMRFDSDYHYKVADMDHDGSKAGFAMTVSGKGAFQHGSVIHISKHEYDMLSIWSNVTILLKKALANKAQSGTAVYDEAIEFAEKTLETNRTVSDLLAALPEAYDRLVDANGKYLAEKGNGFNDISDLLVNPDFNDNNGGGWSGTGFTAANAGVAEHFSRNFDTYQILKDMPAGRYRFEAQGFYRFGLETEARKAHNDGSEKLWAKLYANDAEASFMSLFDETYSSYPNNVWSANSAFNTDLKYDGNSVECVMETAGDLRLGIRKTQMINGDWTCFDNFRLFYNPEISGVENIWIPDQSALVNVTTADGKVLKTAVPFASAADGLAPGIYLIGDRKVIIK